MNDQRIFISPGLMEAYQRMIHPNRLNARKDKSGGGCQMCKPYKHKWEHKFKEKERR